MFKLPFIFLSFLSLAFIVLTGCKKKEEPESQAAITSPCGLYTTVSTDTNYIPHKKNNEWIYCSGDINMAGWDATIPWDTIIGTDIYFDRLFHTGSSHAQNPYYSERWRIDSMGNYYRMTFFAQYKDTLLLIKPNACNGDTIYTNALKQLKVILVNKNEMVGTIPGCYHVRELQGYGEHHYYKKGIGELYFTSFTLGNAKIH